MLALTLPSPKRGLRVDILADFWLGTRRFPSCDRRDAIHGTSKKTAIFFW
jgi:hypothetical protein